MAENPEEKISLEDDGPDCETNAQDKLSPFWIWMGSICFIGIALAIGSLVLAYYIWPSLTSSAILTVWIFIAVYAFWSWVIEPLYFRCSQWCSHIFG